MGADGRDEDSEAGAPGDSDDDSDESGDDTYGALRARPFREGPSRQECDRRIALLLYDNPTSSNALKVRFLLAELGLSYERRTVPYDLARPDWYLAVNPVGGIPTLHDGGFVLSESNAILRYLANRDGRHDLRATPRDARLPRRSLRVRPRRVHHRRRLRRSRSLPDDEVRPRPLPQREPPPLA